MRDDDAIAGRDLAWLGLVAAFLAGYSAVGVRNFGGWDEWLVLSLSSKGITDFPYANRPLAGLWALPGALALPSTLAGYWLMQVVYLCLAGLVVLALARRLAPREPLVALIASAAALVFVPLDVHRLNPLNNLVYSGATFAALAALYGLVFWVEGRSPLFLGAAIVAGLAASRSYEGTLGLLAAGSAVLLVALGPQARRRTGSALAPWALTVALAAALAAFPLLFGGPTYQGSGLGLDLSPLGVASRVLQQLQWLLAPLVGVSLKDLLSWRVLAAVGGFAAALASRPTGLAGAWDRRRLLELSLAGLALAVSGWGIMLLSPALAAPARMQGFSAPGAGVLLGSAACLAAAAAPARWRVSVAAALGTWIVAAGTAHTLSLQRQWDAASAYPRQARLLRELTRTVPGVVDSTLVVLLDDEQAFPASFTFRHAVDYLYSGRALGAVAGGHSLLYSLRFGPEGVTSEPWPVIRRPWGEPVRRFGYDEVIVLRQRAGALTLLEQWPQPSLPEEAAEARYAPRARIVPGAAPGRAALLSE